MALSPYRFSLDDEEDGATLSRSRTGLSSVTAGGGGATSGGEGYRASALAPGSRGYMAATFGGAPDPTYVRPVTPTPEPVVPAVPAETQAPAPVAQRQSVALAENAEGAGGETGIADPGEPGDLTDLIGDISIDGKTVGGMLGATAGGLLAGPAGALAGGIAGRAIGSSLSSSSGGGGGFGGDNDPANAGSASGGSANSAAAGFGGGYGTGLDGWGGLAQGGRVRPGHLEYGRQAMMKDKGGLGGVMAGGKNMGGYAMGGKVKMPNYAEGGTVDALAGPNPPGPDDGFAALDGGEFVVRQSMADKYAPILDDINEGRFPAPGQGAGMGPQGGAGMGDLDLPMGAQGNMPPSGAESATPDDMMQRLATLPPEQRQTLQMAMSDAMLSGALFALLGPAFMPVIATLQQPMVPQGMGQPAMMATPPDLAGSRPMGGLGAVNA